MPTKNEPWNERWTILSELGQGGQGTTYKVRETGTENIAVLKDLNDRASRQARARMHREVTNLRTLSSLGAKVPRVLDGNTNDYETDSPRLYFVMEFMRGQTLKAIIDDRKKLTLDESASLVLDLLDTVNTAHANDIVHRDIKPENIIVRDLSTPDAVIVDFGLSYQHETDNTVTITGETMRNRFLVLPELNTLDGERRDPRSDLTALTAVLYYCLTGREPRMLRSSSGAPIHRTSGSSIREFLATDPRLNAVESFLDRGLAYELEQRFTNCAEFKGRLRQVLTANSRVLKDPIQIGKDPSSRLGRLDNKTQLAQI